MIVLDTNVLSEPLQRQGFRGLRYRRSQSLAWTDRAVV